MEIAIGVSIIIFSVLAALIPSFAQVRRPRNKKITLAGYSVIAIIILLVSAQTYQLYLIDKQKEQDIKAQLKRDKEVKDYILKNNSSITTPFAEGLAKYGLKFDSAKREIKAIVQNDTNKKTIIFGEASPEFTTNEATITYNGKDTLKFTVGVLCKQASAYKCRINTRIVVRDTNDKLYDIGYFFPYYTEKVIIDDGFSHDKSIPVEPKLYATMKATYFLSTGNYEDKAGKKYPFNDLVVFRVGQPMFGRLTEKENIWIKDFYNKLPN